MWKERNASALAVRAALVLALAASGCVDISDELAYEPGDGVSADNAGGQEGAKGEGVEAIEGSVQNLSDAMTSPGQNGFGPKYLAHRYFCIANEDCQTGDFNGDGRDDVVTFVPANGDVWVALSNGRTFDASNRWRAGYSNRSSYYDVGDVDGDGKDDIVRFNRVSGDVHVSYSNGSSFGHPTRHVARMCAGPVECRVGSVNNDPYGDVVKFVGGGSAVDRNGLVVALGRGDGARSPVRWGGSMCGAPSACELADTNGDGLDDVVQINKTAGGGRVWVATSTGSTFRSPISVVNRFCAPGESCELGDVNGTGRADLVNFQRRHYGSDFPRADQADVLTALSRWTNNSSQLSYGAARIRTDRFCILARICRLADVDGDGRDDLVSFARDESSDTYGDVFVSLSTFGERTNWRMDLDRMRALAVEGDADQPYFIALSFRSTFGRRGSTTIRRNQFRDTRWAHRIRPGEQRAIPSWEGEHVFRNVVLPSFAELFGANPPPVEVLGTLVVAMEHDWTPWGEVDGLVDRVEAELRRALQRVVERTPVGLLILDRDGFRDKIDEATRRLRDSMNVELPEAIRLALVSGFDPDDYIDYHLYLYPAVDKEATDLLPPIPNRRVDLGVPGDGWGGYWPTSDDYIDSDGPIRWRVTSQMELVP